MLPPLKWLRCQFNQRMQQLVSNGLLHFQVVSHTDHSQGLLASVLRVLLHALATNQSTSFLQHLFAVQVWLETGSGSKDKVLIRSPMLLRSFGLTIPIRTLNLGNGGSLFCFWSYSRDIFEAKSICLSELFCYFSNNSIFWTITMWIKSFKTV